MAINRERAVTKRMKVFRQFWYDVALSSTSGAFPSLLAAADPSQVLFGTDFPFAPSVGVKYMRDEYRDLELDAQVRAGIDRDNVEVLFFPRLGGDRR